MLKMTAAQAKALRIPPGTAGTPVRGTGEAVGAFSEAVSKYGAKRTEAFGIVFDSKREAERYSELLHLQSAGEISDLETKTPACVFQLIVNGVKIGRFTADFRYTENGKSIVEDSKSGVASRDYILRKKLMLAVHGITIRETK